METIKKKHGNLNVSRETIKRLQTSKELGETYDHFINRLLDERETKLLSK